MVRVKFLPEGPGRKGPPVRTITPFETVKVVGFSRGGDIEGMTVTFTELFNIARLSVLRSELPLFLSVTESCTCGEPFEAAVTIRLALYARIGWKSMLVLDCSAPKRACGLAGLKPVEGLL